MNASHLLHHPLRLLLLSLLLAALAAGCAARASKDDIRAALREDPSLVLDVLHDNPEAAIAALTQGAQAAKDRQRQERIKAELEQPLTPDLSTPGRLERGPANATVVIVAYSDFTCAYCSRAARTLDELQSRHPDQVRLVFKHFPKNGLSVQLALAVEALAGKDLKLAWQVHDEFFNHQAELAVEHEAAAARIMGGLGVDLAQLSKDMTDPALQKRIESDRREAEEFGFEGTPGFVVNGVSLPGAFPIEEFERIIKLTGEHKASAGQWPSSGGDACTDCANKKQ
jgi:protein-disulfide isomerase